MFLFALVSSINRFNKTRRLFHWLIEIIILLQSLILWANKKEYKHLSDCLFHFRKQSSHPWTHERSIEYPWVAKNITDLQNCCVLDVGAKEGLPSTDLLLNNHNSVYTIDLNTSQIPQSTRGLIVKKGDIRATPFGNGFFDAVVVVSTLEHIGVPGRYGIEEADETGDFKAMAEIFRILKPGGKVLITVPYGVGRSLPLNRLYTSSRIKEVLGKFKIFRTEYYRYFTAYDMWFEVTEPIAAKNNWDIEPWYSLGCFVVVKPETIE